MITNLIFTVLESFYGKLLIECLIGSIKAVKENEVPLFKELLTQFQIIL